jgi:hypothetical protein
MVDALKYRRSDEKNCVEVRIHLTGEDPPGNAAETRAD